MGAKKINQENSSERKEDKTVITQLPKNNVDAKIIPFPKPHPKFSSEPQTQLYHLTVNQHGSEVVHNREIDPEKGPQIYHSQDKDYSGHKPATFFSRFLAIIVDGVIINMASLFFATMSNLLDPNLAGDLLLNLMFQSISAILFYIIPIYITGQSLGKRLLGIKVVNDDYSEFMSFGKILWRESFGRVVSTIFLLGYFACLWNDDNRCWHDKIAQTRVISVK